MLKKSDVLSYLKEHRVSLERDFNILKIGLVGSFSRDENTPQSDIDLIVEFKPHTQDLQTLKQNLKKSIQKRFDPKVELCREKYIKSYYKKRLLRDAIFV